MSLSQCRRRSRKRRRQKAYSSDFQRLLRLSAVRDRGDHRRWDWIADPSSIECARDTFEPVRNDGLAEYEGHFAFDFEHGRTWVVDSEKKIGQEPLSSPSQEP